MSGDDQSSRRRHARLETRMFAKISNGMKIDGAMVQDLSMSGIGLEMHSTADQEPGNQVEIHCGELGCINGAVRWVRPDRVGIEFAASSNNAAKIAAFFKHFKG
ncbi:PilZ domain-containing protein [Oricola cellulosilytica]|uniref:PilZ domain-containing protein n=1 Tax=Oricola cellulosilytica TaxID=1429082 RepID=A0A4R0P2A3_9HYPH|nr:PilZ domain-containing protein [Oricola cellulosilytica]TCD10957.1 PilZ domain-containing protein [Oricola cellulosilytica]